MKKTGFNLICKLWCTILLCTGILTGCDNLIKESTGELNADINDEFIDGITPTRPSMPSIRPRTIDMTGVQGFAIVENISNSPRTKADIDGDGVDDDIMNKSPYTLYTIDENGELHVSIFYFETVPSGDNGVDAPNTEVLNEVSNAFQVVPSLVTDLGKYILFSGCQYQISDSDISDEALSICETYIRENTREDMTYMIRKSDGALFDFTQRGYFTYDYYWDDGVNEPSLQRAYNYFFPDKETKGAHIAENTYMTSAKGNLFTNPLNCFVSKFEDNGDAINVRQMTQSYGTPPIERFIIDTDENIYLFVNDSYMQGDAELDIYYANGGFNVYDFKSTSNTYKSHDVKLLDMKTDESGVPYILFWEDARIVVGTNENGKEITESLKYLKSARLNNGVVEPISEIDAAYPKNFFYLVCHNKCFNWCLLYAKSNYKILSYNINTHTFTLKDGMAELNQIITAVHDVIVYGSKTYCATVNGNSIEVTEIDLASETSRSYTLSIDLTAIVKPTYTALMMQNVPYLTINGRNTANGANVSITVNLINGETNSSFAQDGRNVVSFFRIN